MVLLPTELQTQAREKALECCTKASTHFRRHFPIPPVDFKLRGLVAGHARLDNWSISINQELLVKYPDEQIQVTVPHEVAHLVAHSLYGRFIRPHGLEWSSIMTNVFRVPPTRCHNMQATPARQVRKYKTYCACPKPHMVSRTLLRRMQQGKVYKCRTCHTSLSLQLHLESFDDLLAAIK